MKIKMYDFLCKLYFLVHDFIETRFFYYSSKLFKLPHPKNNYPYRVKDFLSRVHTSDRIADLGCGTGKLVQLFLQNNIFATGVDQNKPLLLNPENYIKSNILDKSLIDKLTEKKISTICLSHILEHIEDPISFLKSLTSFKKVLICVPSQENWRFQEKTRLGLQALSDPTHFREYTKEMLINESIQSGYNIQEIFYNSEGEIFAVIVQINI